VRHIRGEALTEDSLLNYGLIGVTSDLYHTSLNILIYKNGAEDSANFLGLLLWFLG
jgi:hypothetical protein